MRLRGRDVRNGEAIELEFGGGTAVCRRVPETDRDGDGSDLPWISSGWIDLQVNGWAGIDYNGDDLNTAGMERLCGLLARRGTTRHLPTIITASREAMLRRLAAVAAFRRDSEYLTRRIPGFHVEGPFISGADGARGAHGAEWVRNPSAAEFEDWMEAAGGLVKIVTLAPERPGALKFIEMLASRGVTVALGHTVADSALIHEAAAAGARMSTHLGNGMEGRVDRHSNVLWPQLADDRLLPSLIADGHHLPDDFLKTVYRGKGAGNFVLVSDAAPPGGSGPGRMKWCDADVEVDGDGRIGLAGTPFLAGAGHLLDRSMARFVEASGCSAAEAAQACTSVPAALIGMPEFPVMTESGSPGDAVAFRLRSGMPEASIEAVVVDGESIPV